MSNLTLEQVGILERLAAAEAACTEAAELIGCRPPAAGAFSGNAWSKGRNEGVTLERLEQCQRSLGAVQVCLAVRMEWV